MMDLKKLQKVIDTFNSYYSFALVLYAFVLYAAAHSQVFLFVAIGLTPVLTAWGGYLLHGYFFRRNQRYGFRVLSDRMSYEVIGKDRYKLKFDTKIKAELDHLFTFPIAYRWTGKGKEYPPVLAGDGQQLLGVVRRYDNDEIDKAIVGPYIETLLSEGQWRYWLIGLTPPLYKGDETELHYSQTFVDESGSAGKYINYHVRNPMKRLELNVKFPKGALPKTVTASYLKRNERRHSISGKGLTFDPDKQWATWVINNPKKDYCYSIRWR